jgi:hypothetical protein
MTIQALKAFLTAPASECKFSQLNAVFSDPKIRPDITFWGERVITVQEEEGSVSLNALADRVVSIIRARCLSSKNWPSNTTPDKEAAKSVVDYLWKYYSQTDTLIAHTKNYFTWFLAKIRNFGTTATLAHADVEYLHDWNFEVGYEIPRCSLLWGHYPIPAWAGDHKSAEELETLQAWSISLEKLEDPVIDKCGHTFERNYIETWLQSHHTCPISRNRVTIEDLIPNRVVKQAIDILKQRGRAQDGSVAVADEKERAIILRAATQLRPKTFARKAGDYVEKISNCSSSCC